MWTPEVPGTSKRFLTSATRVAGDKAEGLTFGVPSGSSGGVENPDVSSSLSVSLLLGSEKNPWSELRLELAKLESMSWGMGSLQGRRLTAISGELRGQDGELPSLAEKFSVWSRAPKDGMFIGDESREDFGAGDKSGDLTPVSPGWPIRRSRAMDEFEKAGIVLLSSRN